MNIVLLSNTFTPHVGGVARSVQAFSEEYRKLGHRVLVVAPQFPGMPDHEEDVVRIRAIQKFNSSDFSVALPVPKGLSRILDDFEPDLVHSQHPFLLGMTALRIARARKLPLVFTHHTLYEEYTHYVPGDSQTLKKFVIELATRYANLSDQVIAPSESIARLLRERGVTTPVEVIPTGVYVEKFSGGDGDRFRLLHNIPVDSFVVGHMGRLAEEKNLPFLGRAVSRFMKQHDNTCFLVVGSGESENGLRKMFDRAAMAARLVMPGTLENEALADALNAMDVFAFASRSETQGLVLIEAMAAGLPVVGLDANGVREVITDGVNGRLVESGEESGFHEALNWVYQRLSSEPGKLEISARETAQAYAMEKTARRALDCFSRIQRKSPTNFHEKEKQWEQVLARISAEWEIVKSLAAAGDKAIGASLTPAKEIR